VTLDELRGSASPAENGWHRFPPPYRQMSPTLEEAEFLYALVRATKPRNVLELGTGLGVTARFIAEALKTVDGEAHLLTVEPVAEFAEQARTLLEGLPATVVRELSDAEFLDDPHLVYIDSGYEYRADDMRTWLTNGYAGLVVVHDADRQYLEFDLGVGVFLPTANGMWIGHGK